MVICYRFFYSLAGRFALGDNRVLVRKKDCNMGTTKIKNILSFDVEEWFVGLDPVLENWSLYPSRIVDELDLILNLLDKHNTKATFFILVDTIRNHEWILRRILDAGHEIASHGVKHRFIYQQEPEEFKKDIKESIDYLEKVTGNKIRGYRAPYFSINNKSLWALKIIEEIGLKYDSSVFPVFNHRYGIPEAPRFAYKLQGSKLWEFPPATGRIAGINIGLGGVYFRFLPFEFICKAVQKLNSDGYPAVFYFHPWEFDADQPRLNCSPFLRIRHYKRLQKAFMRLEKLISLYSFGSFSEFIDNCNSKNIWKDTFISFCRPHIL